MLFEGCGSVFVIGNIDVTDDFIALGNEDAFISIMEDSVMFGSSVTGSNFTMDNVVTEQKKNGDIVMSFDDGQPGSSSFNADGSFVMNDGTVDVLSMTNTVYNYTEEGDGGFVITGESSRVELS